MGLGATYAVIEALARKHAKGGKGGKGGRKR